jgi:hypothetical protein
MDRSEEHSRNNMNNSERNSCPKSVLVEHPYENDVLCGRGVPTNNWKGNEQFRALVALKKIHYVTSTRREKMIISRSIVHAIRSMEPPGRFLDRKDKTGPWYDIGDKKAIEKTSQALRDSATAIRKQLSDDFGNPDFSEEMRCIDEGASKGGFAEAVDSAASKIPADKAKSMHQHSEEASNADWSAFMSQMSSQLKDSYYESQKQKDVNLDASTLHPFQFTNEDEHPNVISFPFSQPFMTSSTEGSLHQPLLHNWYAQHDTSNVHPDHGSMSMDEGFFRSFLDSSTLSSNFHHYQHHHHHYETCKSDCANEDMSHETSPTTQKRSATL